MPERSLGLPWLTVAAYQIIRPPAGDRRGYREHLIDPEYPINERIGR